MDRFLVLLLVALTGNFWAVNSASAQPAPVLSQAGVELVVQFEVGGPKAYINRYQRPICPACLTTASGPTIGIGYDLGHQRGETIVADWSKHPDKWRLAEAQGLGGAAAVYKVKRMQDILTPLPLAMEVFQTSTAPRYWNIARRSFGPGFMQMPQHVQDALTDVVYNRGGAMEGPKRLEMRLIRDKCIPARSSPCVAEMLRVMRRHWVGTTIEAGISRRCFARAALVER